MESSTNSSSRLECDFSRINHAHGEDFSTSLAAGCPAYISSSPEVIGQSVTVSTSHSNNLVRDTSTTVPENVLRRNPGSNVEITPVDSLPNHVEANWSGDFRVERDPPSAKCPKRKALTATECSFLTIDQQIAKCTISATELMTFVPELAAVELSYIGQSVSLQTQTSCEDNDEGSEWMYYEGIINMVTPSCISLMDVRRFTLCDYNNFVAQKEQVDAEEQQRSDPFLNPSLPFLFTSEGGRHQRRAPSPTTHPFAPACQVLSAEKQSTRKPVTMGPFPFITVVRKSIREVKFIPILPRSSFTIFSDSAKRIVDMQYLRIFVRRYLVHRSLKSSSTRSDLTLKEYIACRCNVINIDVTLLEAVAKEEIRFLLEVNEKMLMCCGHSFRRGGELELLDEEETARGLLVATGLPHFTVSFSTFSIMILLCGLFYSLFFLFCVQKPPLTSSFVVEDWVYYFIGFLITSPAIVIIGYHGVIMTPPRSSQILISAVRLSLTVISLLINIVCIVQLANRCRNSTGFDFYTSVEKEQKLCEFFLELHCSGWFEPNKSFIDENCQELPYFPQDCRSSLMLKMRMIALPVAAILLVLCFLLIFSIGLLVLMFYYIREIFNRRLVIGPRSA